MMSESLFIFEKSRTSEDIGTVSEQVRVTRGVLVGDTVITNLVAKFTANSNVGINQQFGNEISTLNALETNSRLTSFLEKNAVSSSPDSITGGYSRVGREMIDAELNAAQAAATIALHEVAFAPDSIDVIV